MRNVNNITNFDFLKANSEFWLNLLLYGSNKLDCTTNRNILKETIKYIKGTKRFSSDSSL